MPPWVVSSWPVPHQAENNFFSVCETQIEAREGALLGFTALQDLFWHLSVDSKGSRNKSAKELPESSRDTYRNSLLPIPFKTYNCIQAGSLEFHNNCCWYN